MNKKAIQWLYNELPELIRKQVLSPETAQQLQNHYGPLDDTDRPSLGLILFSILGTILISLGIILLFAHNWQNLSRPVRVVLSFTPLVLGQALGGWVLLKKQNSRAWQEGSALFIMGGIGSSIALIGQTYHISGDPERFMLAWMLLSVPLVYLLNSSMTAALYWVGISSWAILSADYGGSHQQAWFFPLAALALPHLWSLVRRDPRSHRAAFLLWALGLCLVVVLGQTHSRIFPHAWAPSYGVMLACFYLLDRYWGAEATELWRRPLFLIGATGIVVMSLVMTFDIGWKQGGWDALWGNWHDAVGFAWQRLFLMLLLLGGICLSIWLLITGFHRRQNWWFFGSAGLLVVVSDLLITFYMADGLVMLLFNLYLTALGIDTLRRGLRSGHFGAVNGGLIILAALITARFFDSDLPFVFKGVMFILIGIGFLATNLITHNKRRTA